MVIDDKRLFVTEVSIDYIQSSYQIEQALKLLENREIRKKEKKNLNLPYDPELVADDIEHRRK
jgi:hypothetical protein